MGRRLAICSFWSKNGREEKNTKWQKREEEKRYLLNEKMLEWWRLISVGGVSRLKGQLKMLVHVPLKVICLAMI